MKYTQYHFRRIQGCWFNHGETNFAASKREARALPYKPNGYTTSPDDVYVWLRSDSAPKQVGSLPGGSFPLESAV